MIAILLTLIACSGGPSPSTTPVESPSAGTTSEGTTSEGTTSTGTTSEGPSTGMGVRPDDCAMMSDGWCPSPPGDPCGAHKDKPSCQADPKCEGMPYRGESMVACQWDDRFFATNCPTVGCVSACPSLDQAACSADARCSWNGTACERQTKPTGR